MMYQIISRMHKALENKTRLAIVSLLSVHSSIDFLELKELLNTTDGNLASHVAALEKESFLVIEKKIVGKKTNTSYQLTETGRAAFKEHLQALEELVKSSM